MTEHVVVQDEPFNLNRVFGKLYFDYCNEGIKAFSKHEAYIFNEKIVFKQIIRGNLANKFEEHLLEYLISNGYKSIYLYRENVQEEYLSLVNALYTNVWSVWDNKNNLNSTNYDVDLRKLGVFLSQIESKKKQILPLLKNNCLLVSYEELYREDSFKTIRRILKYLEIEEEVLAKKSGEIKLLLSNSNQESKKNFHLISNYDKVFKIINNIISRYS